MRGKYRDSPCPHTYTASPIFNIIQQSGTFVTEDEPALIHHNHPKFIVHLRFHYWSCIFFCYGQTYGLPS